MKTNRSQSSVEFVVILVIVLLLFVMLLHFMTARVDEAIVSQDQIQLNTVLSIVEKELVIAKDAKGTYSRSVQLPELDVDYELFLFNGKELVLRSAGGELVKFLNIYIYDNITSFSGGESFLLVKDKGRLGICDGACDLDALFDQTGKLLCREDRGYWSDCTFEYGVFYDEIRYDCGMPVSSAKLEFYAKDDSYLALDSDMGSLDGSEVIFENLNFFVNESGWWDVNVTCGLLPEQLVDSVYTPYGTLEFYPLEIGSGCSNVNDSNLCEAEENFTIISRIKCLGGECGDAKIWLDP